MAHGQSQSGRHVQCGTTRLAQSDPRPNRHQPQDRTGGLGTLPFQSTRRFGKGPPAIRERLERHLGRTQSSVRRMRATRQPKAPSGRHVSAQGSALGKSSPKNPSSPERANKDGGQQPKLHPYPAILSAIARNASAEAGQRRRTRRAENSRRRNELNEALAAGYSRNL